ncbi:MAG: HAMP domain-containing sensor histidine kinase [Actinomycetota bacterium]
MSLRLRITLVVVVIVAVVVTVVGQRVYAAAEAELVEEVDIELLGRAEGIQQLARGPQFDRTFSGTILRNLPPTIERNGFGPDTGFGPRTLLDESTQRANFSRVVDALGDVIIDLGPEFDVDLAAADFPGVAGAPVLSDGAIEGQRARIVTIAASDVYVQLARPLGEIDQSLDDLAGRIVFISLTAVLVAAAASWFLSGSTVAPIRRLTDAAERVAETGDLDQPVDGSGGAEVGRLAGSFNSMLAALSASRHQQHQLVMDASHELRTPLASLQTNVDVLRSGREIPDDMQRAIVDDLHAEIGELGDLVAELVDLATDVRSDEDPVPVELADLAAPVVERQARRSDRAIELRVDRRAVVEARPQAVSRAIRNLVENAAKFSPPGSPITVVADGGAIAVLDAGPGIPVADRTKVFDRFHRVEATRTMPGSGLGLAIVKQVAEAHGGSVSVGESPSGGAAVAFTIPTVDD